ncbi:MAG: aldehyde dehydrogenase family protein, partial [Bacteroidota bacterium]
MPLNHPKYPDVQNYVDGKFVPSSSSQFLEVISPIDGTLISKVPLSTAEDLNQAVRVAQHAFSS